MSAQPRPLVISLSLWLVGACAFIRDEAPVRRLSDAEAARLPELAAETRRQDAAELAASAEPATTRATSDQQTFEQTLAAIAAADAAQARDKSPNSGAGAEKLPECHRLVARAAQSEADERVSGRRSDGGDTVARRKAAMACLAKHPEGVESRDDDGATPLHIAAMFGGEHMADALLRRKADWKATDNRGNYPADFAEAAGFSELAVKLARGDARTDWRLGRFPASRAQVTNAGSIFVRTWVGEVFRICTSDGKPPRDDQRNVLFALKVTWGSDGRCIPRTLFYGPDQLKDARAISLAMRPCNPVFPAKEEAEQAPCERSDPIW